LIKDKPPPNRSKVLGERVSPLLSSVFHKYGDVFYPTPTLALPLNGREISPFKGEVRRGMGYVSE